MDDELLEAAKAVLKGDVWTATDGRQYCRRCNADVSHDSWWCPTGRLARAVEKASRGTTTSDAVLGGCDH